MEPKQQPTLQVEITWRSIYRVLFAILFATICVVLWPMFKLVSLSILIAVALYPMVTWACRKGFPRWVGITIAASTLLLIAVGFFAVIGPMLFKQSQTLIQRMPELGQEVLSHLPASELAQRLIKETANLGPHTQPIIRKILELGTTTLTGVFELLLVLIVAIYLIVDGPRLVRWLIVFLPRSQRQKLDEALPQIGELIFAYMVGQFITSAICAAFVFTILTVLHVPMALLLAVMAGIFDILPIIGFFLSVIPSMAMGLTVSTGTALIILALYGGYHLFENYFIVPKVYGRKLQLSTLAVILAIIAGGLIGGVPGAIVVLPLVAAYPVAERIWLAPKLEPDTVTKHEQMHSSENPAP